MSRGLTQKIGNKTNHNILYLPSHIISGT
jgi:hypothetical protein